MRSLRRYGPTLVQTGIGNIYRFSIILFHFSQKRVPASAICSPIKLDALYVNMSVKTVLIVSGLLREISIIYVNLVS